MISKVSLPITNSNEVYSLLKEALDKDTAYWVLEGDIISKEELVDKIDLAPQENVDYHYGLLATDEAIVTAKYCCAKFEDAVRSKFFIAPIYYGGSNIYEIERIWSLVLWDGLEYKKYPIVYCPWCNKKLIERR